MKLEIINKGGNTGVLIYVALQIVLFFIALTLLAFLLLKDDVIEFIVLVSPFLALQAAHIYSVIKDDLYD